MFSDTNNIANLVRDMSRNCSNRLGQLLHNWIQMDMIFKRSRSKMYLN